MNYKRRDILKHVFDEVILLSEIEKLIKELEVRRTGKETDSASEL